MNYTIGRIMFSRQGLKKDALPYLYKATQFNSGTKVNPAIYQMIGSYYIGEFNKLDNERVNKSQAAGEKDRAEILGMLKLQKGYAERAVEAYAKAYIVNNNEADKPYGEMLLKRVKELYAFRFDYDMTGLERYLANIASRSFTNPEVKVSPIK